MKFHSFPCDYLELQDSSATALQTEPGFEIVNELTILLRLTISCTTNIGTELDPSVMTRAETDQQLYNQPSPRSMIRFTLAGAYSPRSGARDAFPPQPDDLRSSLPAH